MNELHRRDADNLHVKWIDRGMEPQCPSDPELPDGFDFDATEPSDTRTCHTALPYPAKRCGYYLLTCSQCALQVILTTAGRRDDPRSVRLACNGWIINPESAAV